jgi:hypothetical protein
MTWPTTTRTTRMRIRRNRKRTSKSWIKSSHSTGGAGARQSRLSRFGPGRRGARARAGAPGSPSSLRTTARRAGQSTCPRRWRRRCRCRTRCAMSAPKISRAVAPPTRTENRFAPFVDGASIVRAGVAGRIAVTARVDCVVRVVTAHARKREYPRSIPVARSGFFCSVDAVRNASRRLASSNTSIVVAVGRSGPPRRRPWTIRRHWPKV